MFPVLLRIYFTAVPLCPVSWEYELPWTPASPNTPSLVCGAYLLEPLLVGSYPCCLGAPRRPCSLAPTQSCGSCQTYLDLYTFPFVHIQEVAHEIHFLDCTRALEVEWFAKLFEGQWFDPHLLFLMF